MEKSSSAFRLGPGAIVFAVLTGGFLSVSGLPQALAEAQTGLNGRSFFVSVTNLCAPVTFNQTLCFVNGLMVVNDELSGLCASGPAHSVSRRGNVLFVSRVSGTAGTWPYLGVVHGSAIHGLSSRQLGCEVLPFSGSEIATCPCPPSVEQPQESDSL